MLFIAGGFDIHAHVVSGMTYEFGCGSVSIRKSVPYIVLVLVAVVSVHCLLLDLVTRAHMIFV